MANKKNKLKTKVLESKIRNFYNITEKQKEAFKNKPMFKQLSIPFKENYRNKIT